MASAGEVILKATLDADGVETGSGKAKKSLASLSQTAGQTADTMSAANARTSASIDRYIQKQQLAAQTMGKSATEAKLFELAQRGASTAQLRAADSALRAVDAFNKQEASSARAQAAALRFGAVVAAGAAIAATAILSMGRNALNAMDQFNDLSDATGASVENISALDRVARENGQTFDTVASALTKFNQALNASDEEGSKAAQVLKAIGLSAADLKRLDPAEALRQTAVALARFANDGDKARAVQILFGKSIQEVGPLLKDLSEQTALVGSTSTKAAQDAETFNKHLFALKANAQDAARSLLTDLLPALNAVAAGLKQGGLLGLLTTGGDQTGDPGKAISVLNEKLAATRKLLADLDPKKSIANKINDFVFGDVGDLEKQIALFEKQRGYLQGLQSQLALNGVGDTGDALSRRLTPRSLGSIPDAPSGSKKDPLAEAKQYLESLQKQLQTVKEMTVYEKLMDDIRSKRIGKVTPDLQKKLEATAREVDLIKEKAKAEEELGRTRNAADQLQRQSDDTLRGSVEQQVESNQQMRDEIELLGLEGQARAAVEKARLSSAIALKEETLVVEQGIEGNEARVALLQREITLLKERLGLIGQRADKQEVLDTPTLTAARDREIDEVESDLSGAIQAALASDKPIKAFAETLGRTVFDRLSKAAGDALAQAFLEQIGGSGGSWVNLIGSLFGNGGFGSGSAYGNQDLGLNFDGGGYTGSGARSGGMDGKGGFMAMLHPKETVLDHTKGQSMGGGATINIVQNITTTDTVSKAELESKLRDSNRQMAAALDRSQRISFRGA